MEYVTIDFDIADRILPSYCCISAITWKNGIMSDVYSSYIYPDCDIEKFMKDRHGIDNKDVETAPTMTNVWNEVKNIIEDKLVFFVNGAKDIDMLIKRLEVDYLEMPNLQYASLISICKRTWKNISKYNMSTITSELNITSKHYNSMDDAISMGIIINKSLEIHKVSSLDDLFNKIGYAGGYIISGQKVVYRARKDKKSKEYYQLIPEEDKEI